MNYIKINRRFGILTISSVFLLLLAGGVVRSTGSGMGCPDWPKCYNGWFPPTCVCELPSNYQQLYLEKRLKKAEKFSELLMNLGFKKQAILILNDPKLQIPEVFNTTKAWIEYINRLIGVLSGFFSLIFFVTLIKIRKTINISQFIYGVLGFIFMLFNGWLGSIVVATNLFSLLITIHYLLAYAVLLFFILSLHKHHYKYDSLKITKYYGFYLFFVLFSVVQIIYGTQLRAVTDKALEKNILYINNEVNYDFLGNFFKIHWIFAIIMVVLSLIPVFTLYKKINFKEWRWVFSISIVLGFQYLSGVLNLNLNFPLIAQVSHILFAGLVFAISLYICTSIYKTKKS